MVSNGMQNCPIFIWRKTITLALLLSHARPGAIITNLKNIVNDKDGVGFVSFCYFSPWNLQYRFVRGQRVMFSL